MNNENNIKKHATARSHDLLSDSIPALFGGTQKPQKTLSQDS
jgi:hypothetical protein